jgi:hypothetical protein
VINAENSAANRTGPAIISMVAGLSPRAVAYTRICCAQRHRHRHHGSAGPPVTAGNFRHRR